VISADGKRLAGVSPDGAIELRDVQNGRRLRTFPKTAGPAESLAFTPGGESLVAVILNREVQTWDTSSGQLRRKANLPAGLCEAYAVSPDGGLVVGYQAPGASLLWRWDVATGKERVLAGHAGHVDAVACGPGGRLVATGCAGENAVRAWAADGKPLRELAPERLRRDRLALAFSPDGRLLACAGSGMPLSHKAPGQYSRPARLAVWDTTTWDEVPAYAGADQRAGAVAFSPDGRLLACGDEGGARLVEPDTGREVRRLAADESAAVYALAFSADGRLLAAAASYPRSDPQRADEVRVWEASTGREVRRLTGPGPSCGFVALSADGTVVAAADANRWTAWEVATGQQVATVAFPRPVGGHGAGQSPDGKLLVAGSLLWDMKAGRAVGELTGHHGPVTAVAFSPDSRTLTTGSTDTTGLVWDVAALVKRRPRQVTP
jgi:WD40 repeat protein